MATSELFKDHDDTNASLKYLNIKNSINCRQGRDFIDSLWLKFKKYADKQFIKEFKSDLIQRFWEMYLGCTFLENGFIIDSKDIGPDFYIKADEKFIIIEAVAPKAGEGQDKVETPPEMKVVLLNREPIVLRITNAINEKKRQYDNWLSRGIINSNWPFVIAINLRDIPMAFLESDPPIILRALTELGKEYFTYNVDNFELLDVGYEYEDKVAKQSGSVVEKNIFSLEKYNNISAIIFSVVDPMNRPVQLGDDFEIAYNPIAKNPLENGYFRFGTEYYREENTWHRKQYDYK